MNGTPGGGCNDPREIHPHWCGFCGAKLLFAQVACRQLRFVPPCLRCGEKQWRSEVDELVAPDFHEP